LKRAKKEEENAKRLGEKIWKIRSRRIKGIDEIEENDNTRRRKRGNEGEIV
jgi:hypothetical protein